MISVFELALANWAPICHFLVNNVNEWWGVLVVLYKLAIGFAVVNVISGVFLHETFKVASSDDELMIVQKRRALQKHCDKMQRLLKEADVSGDGFIQREEFREALSKPVVRTWLSAMEVETGDVDLLFDLIDNGDEEISIQELVQGISRLKGGARSIDVVNLTHRAARMELMIGDIARRVTRLHGKELQESKNYASPADFSDQDIKSPKRIQGVKTAAHSAVPMVEEVVSPHEVN